MNAKDFFKSLEEQAKLQDAAIAAGQKNREAAEEAILMPLLQQLQDGTASYTECFNAVAAFTNTRDDMMDNFRGLSPRVHSLTLTALANLFLSIAKSSAEFAEKHNLTDP